MRLVTYEGAGRSARVKIWGELGAAERSYIAGQEEQAALEEAEEEIEVRVLSHTPQQLRSWLTEAADRAESTMFDRGRAVGKAEAYDRAWKVGLVALGVVYLVDRAFG